MNTTEQRVADWFAARVPPEWFTQTPEVLADRDEVLVVGTLPEPAAGADPAAAEALLGERIDEFRERTRESRMRIAREAERRFDRAVAWGAQCGGVRRLFTTGTVPVMTRLRLPERRVLDTLVDAGVARSRSDALAWCVRLVRANEDEWLRDLREAFQRVERVRAAGPRSRPPEG